MKSRLILLCALTVVGAFALALAPSAVFAVKDEPQFTDEFPLASCKFVTTSLNPYFLLQPGRELYLNNQNCVGAGECDELEEVWITVLEKTRRITLNVDGVANTATTRVVQERETADGELVEISHNYYADCAGTQDVYYFGEIVDIYADGEVVSHDGAWLAGQDGAQPGIIMPGGAFQLGSRYYQEVAPGVALDRAEHMEQNLDITVPAGTFEGCVLIDETTPLEPGSVSTKIYCPGIGLVMDGDVELVSIAEDDD